MEHFASRSMQHQVCVRRRNEDDIKLGSIFGFPSIYPACPSYFPQYSAGMSLAFSTSIYPACPWDLPVFIRHVPAR